MFQIMIYITLKILVLLQFIRILKRSFRSIIDFNFFFFLNSQHKKIKSPGLEEYKTMEESIIKDARNLFRVNKLEK